MTPAGIRHVALVGPTASGKSALALEIALASHGGKDAVAAVLRRHWPEPMAAEIEGASPFEIVSVDSMCVYRGMDVGTAKPSVQARRLVPHHMVDVADPWEEYSLSRFQVDALASLEAIERRGRRALLVGGTGLYLRAVTDGLHLPGRWPAIKHRLEDEARSNGTPMLYRRLLEVDPAAAARMEETNTRRIVRALEVTLGSGRPFSSFGPGLVHYPDVPFRILGLDDDPSCVDERIAHRVAEQMSAGFLDEVATLARSVLPVSRTASQALGYRELFSHVRGEITLQEAIDQIVGTTRRFARRQRRWFRRDPRIVWCTSVDSQGARRTEPPAILGR